MGTADQLFNRFVEAWNTGQRPDVDDYCAQMPEADCVDFRRMVTLFLERAPRPPLDDEAHEALRADPSFRQVASLAGSEGGLWSQLLPRLREKARLSREQLVARLSETLGVPSEQERVKLYYHQMESGALDPSGVSQKVLDALAGLLGTDSDELERAGDFRGIVEPDQAVFARSDDAIANGARALSTESPGPGDEVDRLFTGGR